MRLSSEEDITRLKRQAQRIAATDNVSVATVLEEGRAWNWRYDWLCIPKFMYPEMFEQLTVLNVAEPPRKM